MPFDKHSVLARKLADDFEWQLMESLPRIAQAMERDSGDSSFTVTVQFSHRRKKNVDELVAVLKPRERIALEPVEHKIQLDGEQLALFVAAPVTESPEEIEEIEDPTSG